MAEKATITVGYNEYHALVWAAYGAGVPLRVCMAPEHRIARIQHEHRRAREGMHRSDG